MMLFLRVKKITSFPSKLTNLTWYADENRDDLTGAHTSIPTPVKMFISRLLEWSTKPKDLAMYSIPLSEGLGLEILDPITVQDFKLTDNLPRLGWIGDIIYNPSTTNWNLKVFLDEEPVTEVNIIDEEGATTEFIDEEGATTEFIDEETP